MCFRKPSVIAYAAVVGKAENEGPYGGEFDEVVEDNKAGSDTLGTFQQIPDIITAPVKSTGIQL